MLISEILQKEVDPVVRNSLQKLLTDLGDVDLQSMRFPPFSPEALASIEAAPESTADWYARNVLKSEPPTEEPQLSAYNLGIEVGKLLGAERVHKENQAVEEKAEDDKRVVILLVGREEPITFLSKKARVTDGQLLVRDDDDSLLAVFMMNQLQGYYFD